jgi:hypothetical protein
MFGAAREKDRVLEVAAEVDHEMFRCTVLADRRLEDTQRVHPAGILPQDLHSEDVPGVLIDDHGHPRCGRPSPREERSPRLPQASEEWPRHSTIQMTLRYSHLLPDARRDAVRLLNGEPGQQLGNGKGGAG